MRFITCFSISFFVVITCISCKKTVSEITDHEKLEQEGKLVLVTNYSPQDYYVKGDTVEGFNYGLIELLKAYTDLDVRIELESSLEKSIDGLQQGKYHIIARNIPITTELKDQILFTDPIAQNRQVLVQRKAAYNNNLPPIKSLLDLAGKTVHVSKNSPAILRLKNLSEEIASVIYYIEDGVYTDEQLAIMVAEGEIDYAVCDEKNAQRILKDQPELDLNTKIGFTQLEAWIVSKDYPVLLDSLNSWLGQLKETKEYKKLFRKYYP